MYPIEQTIFVFGGVNETKNLEYEGVPLCDPNNHNSGNPERKYGTVINALRSFSLGSSDWKSYQNNGNTPTPRAFSAMTCDSVKKEIFVFGGLSTHSVPAAPIGGLYIYDLNSNKWFNPRFGGATPGALMSASLWYIRGKEPGQRGSLLLYGGLNPSGSTERVLRQLDLSVSTPEWKIRCNDCGPLGTGGGMYDDYERDSTHKIYWYGGKQGISQQFRGTNELWILNTITFEWHKSTSEAYTNGPTTGSGFVVNNNKAHRLVGSFEGNPVDPQLNWLSPSVDVFNIPGKESIIGVYPHYAKIEGPFAPENCDSSSTELIGVTNVNFRRINDTVAMGYGGYGGIKCSHASHCYKNTVMLYYLKNKFIHLAF